MTHKPACPANMGHAQQMCTCSPAAPLASAVDALELAELVLRNKGRAAPEGTVKASLDLARAVFDLTAEREHLATEVATLTMELRHMRERVKALERGRETHEPGVGGHGTSH